MPANLTFDALKAAVAAGEIDTVLTCIVDMQGRLMGKRFHAAHFVNGGHEETHGCNYLLATDIEMNTVQGYKATSWAAGYGDYVHKPDLSTLRRVPWLPGTAMVMCDVLDHHTTRRCPCAPHGAQAPDRPRPRHGVRADDGDRARVLPVREVLRGALGRRLSRPPHDRRWNIDYAIMGTSKEET
jgi:glutamine synthetase